MLSSLFLAALSPTLTVSEPPASPDVPRPSSVLVFPTHRSDARTVTLLSVTNSATSTSGKTFAFFHYVNATPDPKNPLVPQDCKLFCTTEVLTPADTISVLTSCHNPGAPTQGYVVVSAKNPANGQAWSHNHLIGSQLVIDLTTGAVFSLLPAGFRAMPADGAPTDLDRDGRLDFDDKEYEAIPDSLQLDTFLGAGRSRLALLHLSPDRDALVSVDVHIWNDNEFPLSFHFDFRCWFEIDLAQLNPVFTEGYLAGRTPHDPTELDIDCDRKGDLETGWARITGTVARYGGRTKVKPALLGGVVGRAGSIEGGRLLWGSRTSRTGEF